MQNDAVLQVRIDSKLKKEAEDLFDSLGLTLADAVRIFTIQCIESQGFPFDVSKSVSKPKILHAFGLGNKYANPNLISQEKNAWAEAVREKYENR